MASIYDVFADKSDYILDQKMAQAALATPEQSRGVLPWLTEDPVIQVINRPSPPVGAIRPNLSQSSATTSLKTPPSALSDWDIVVKPNRPTIDASNRLSRRFPPPSFLSDGQLWNI